MYSKLFKFGMVAGGRPPSLPHYATSRGIVYGFDSKSDTFNQLYSLDVGGKNCWTVAYSPDGLFIAFSTNTTNPSYYLYQRVGAGYNRVYLPDSPTVAFQDMRWSEDSKYLVVATGASDSGVVVYKRNADNTFTLLQKPASPGNVHGVAANFDGSYFVATLTVTPFVAVYKRNLDDTLTRLANPASLPGSAAERLVFSAANTFLYPQTGAYAVRTYSIDPATDVVTRITSDAGLVNQYSYAIAVSPDKVYTAVGQYNNYSYYKTVNGSSTRLLLGSVSGATGTGVSFSKDDAYLAMAFTNDASSAYMYLFRRTGDTLTALTHPGMTARDVSFAPAVNA